MLLASLIREVLFEGLDEAIYGVSVSYEVHPKAQLSGCSGGDGADTPDYYPL